jgi:Flp pilus assembly protein TadG
MAVNICRQVASLFRRFNADRRGATAIVFALGATVLLGLVGLGTEGGTWYLEKRHGQNAADAAATYGALALASNSASTTIGTDATAWVKSTYSYATGEATVTRGNYNATSNTFTQNASGNAIQALVTRTPSRLFSGLFLSTDPIISETAVAVVNTNGGNACVLAKNGGLSFAGSTQINASNCALASDATGPNAISFTGNKATVSGGTLVSEGGCSNCGNSSGYMLYQPPTTDPYASIQSLTMPPFTPSTGTCKSMPTLSGAVSLNSSYTAESGKMLCSTTIGNGNKNSTTYTGDLSLSAGNSLDFAPGTYIFFDASISVNGGATLTCSTCTPGGAGVTLILTGDSSGNKSNIGTISIDGGANVTLNAPKINSYNAAFDGVLFYMDKNAPPTNGNGNAPVSLGGDGNVHLTGGMYFPSVNVNYSGNVSSSNSAAACTEIIGYSVQFTGNSTMNIAGCTADGTNVAQTKSVQLVQ